MRVLTARYKDLTRVAYSWDGGALYALSQPELSTQLSSGGVQRWDGGDGSPVAVDCGPLAVRRMIVLPAGQLLVSGATRGGGIALARWIGPLVVPRLPGTDRELPNVLWSAPLAIAPSGERIVAQADGRPDYTVVSCRLPPNPGLPVQTEWEEPTGRVLGFAFDPTGTRIAVLNRLTRRTPEGRWVAEEDSLRWHDTVTGKPTGEPIPVPPVGDTNFITGDGTRLVTMRGAFLLSIDLTDPTAKPVKMKSADGKHFTGLAVHPDGRRVLATGNDATVREYDATTLQELRAYAWKVGRLRCVAIAPDGLTAAAGSDKGKVVVWDLE